MDGREPLVATVNAGFESGDPAALDGGAPGGAAWSRGATRSWTRQAGAHEGGTMAADHSPTGPRPEADPGARSARETARLVWESGSWDAVADDLAGVGPALLDAVGISPGARLLDVGAGTGGQLAIPAAQRGAHVVAADVVPAMFDAGRARAQRAGVELEWVEADAAELPFPDGAFDAVCSTFGHMFAHDHARVAAEMVRVCRPGGVLGFAAWTPGGVPGQFFRIVGAALPPPPPGTEPPVLWGTREHVTALLAPAGARLAFRERDNVFTASSLEGYLDHLERDFGPFVAAHQQLGPAWMAVRDELHELLATVNEADDGTLRFAGRYLETVARLP